MNRLFAIWRRVPIDAKCPVQLQPELQGFVVGCPDQYACEDLSKFAPPRASATSRGINLTWALHQLQQNGGGGGLGRVAVVGGGIAGLAAI